jgi:hypothetical protein
MSLFTPVKAPTLKKRAGQTVILYRPLGRRPSEIRDLLRVEEVDKKPVFKVGKHALEKGQIIGLRITQSVGKPGGGHRIVKQFRDYEFLG